MIKTGQLLDRFFLFLYNTARFPDLSGVRIPGPVQQKSVNRVRLGTKQH